jgi:hypothetical protein
MINPWLILAAIVALSASFVGGYTTGSSHKDKEWKLVIADQKDKARLKEQELQGAVDEITKQSKKRQDAIQRKLNDALDGLRNRPDRLPEDSRSSCQGATGAELSRPDSTFLEGEAARADRLREALGTCYEYADKVEGLKTPK